MTDFSAHHVLTFALVATIGALSALAAPGPAVTTVGRCTLSQGDRPIEATSGLLDARVSPLDHRLALLKFADRGYVADLAAGTVTLVPRTGQPLLWLGRNMLWREGDGKYGLIDAVTLAPATRLSLANVELPASMGRFDWLDLMVQVPPGASAHIPKTTSDTKMPGLIRIEDGTPSFDIEGKRPCSVIDSRGRVALELENFALYVRASPDGGRLIVSQGESWGVANLLTGAWTPLPRPGVQWRWLPDGATLVGVEVELSADTKGADPEEGPPVAATHLLILSLGAPAADRAPLPMELQGAEFTILDVSSAGEVLIVVDSKEATAPRTLYLLGLRWAQP